MKIFRTVSFLLWVLAFGFLAPTYGEDWRNLVQPKGTLVIVETAATVNARLGGNPPFETTTDVTTINTSAPQYFVRFYNPSDATYPSNAVGSWAMRAATVRGLTPTQIRDAFALPAMPTHMTLVLVPPGYNLYTGIAGPIAGWGAGGAQQSKLIGPPWVPSANFFNQQPIMAFVLSYRSLAPSGNTGWIAAYLDGRIPTAYSDLENVYLNLDMLYMDTQVSQFRDALDQIGPARYNHLTANALYAGVLFNDAVDQRITSLFSGSTADSGPLMRLAGLSPLPMETKKQDERGNNVWARAVGGVQRAGDLGFKSTLGGMFAGADTLTAEHALAGFSVGVLHSRLDWTGPGGDATIEHGMLGVYAAWMPRDLFVQAGINGGLSRGDVSRRIEFSNINRTAVSRPQTWEANGRARVGVRLPLKAITVVPTAGIDYFYQYREGFTETGADSLNLKVASTNNRTLRSHVGINLSKDVQMNNDIMIAPMAQVGWARERYLDDRALAAGLEGQPDQFIVYGDSKSADILTTGFGIALLSGKNFSFFAQYGLEYRKDRKDQTLSTGLEYRF